MPTITLSDAAFAELKSLAEPFVDTPESLTTRLIHEEVLRRGEQPTRHPPTAPQEEQLRLNPISHENLAHTKLRSAVIDGNEMYRPNWNSVRDHMHVVALKRLGSFDEVARASSARLRRGRYEKEGFRYLPEVDFSIQGVDANLAWDHSLKLARTLGISIRVEFEWREKEGAVRPGRRGLLEWSPATTARVRTPRLADPRQAADFRKEVVEAAADAEL